jgi:hypothetical protein
MSPCDISETLHRIEQMQTHHLYSGHHQMIHQPVIGDQIAREAGLLANVANVTDNVSARNHVSIWTKSRLTRYVIDVAEQ